MPSTAHPDLVADLVTANHILVREGVLDAFGHISVRHDQQADRFLIARSMAPALVTAHDILSCDLDGTVHDPQGRRSYLERFIHSAIYQARPDVMAVVHSHSPSAIPFGVTGARLRPICHMSGFLGAQTPVFDIRHTAGDHTDLLISTQAPRAVTRRRTGRPRRRADARARQRGSGQLDPASRVPRDLHRVQRAAAAAGDGAGRHLLSHGGRSTGCVDHERRPAWPALGNVETQGRRAIHLKAGFPSCCNSNS